MPRVPMLATFRLRQYPPSPFNPIPPETGNASLWRYYPGNKHCLQYQVQDDSDPARPDLIGWQTSLHYGRMYGSTDGGDGFGNPPSTDIFFHGSPNPIPAQVNLGFDSWPPFDLTGEYARFNGGTAPVEVDVPEGMDIFDGRIDYGFPHYYTDADGRDYYGVLTIYTLNESFASVNEPGPSLGYPQANIQVTLTDNDTALIDLGFQVIAHKWNGTTLHTGINRAQIKVDGEITNFVLASELVDVRPFFWVRPDTETRTYDPVNGTVYTPARDLAESNLYNYSGQLTIPFTSADIFIRRGDDYGQWHIWYPLYYRPDVSYTATVEEGVLTVDASACRALGATIGEGSGGYELILVRGPDFLFSFPHETLPRETSSVFDVNLDDLSIFKSPNPPPQDGEPLTLLLIVTTDKGCQNSLIVSTSYTNTGQDLSVSYDEKRLSWWLLQSRNGQMEVERHLKHESPISNGIVVGAGKPGIITRAGAQLFVTSKNGDLYQSLDEGQNWSFVMAIASGVELIAKVAEQDGSAIYHLVRSDAGVLQRVVVKRNGSDWVADAPEDVIGLPSSARSPGSADKSGAVILLAAKSDDGVFAATSLDNMLNWEVSA